MTNMEPINCELHAKVIYIRRRIIKNRSSIEHILDGSYKGLKGVTRD